MDKPSYPDNYPDKITFGFLTMHDVKDTQSFRNNPVLWISILAGLGLLTALALATDPLGLILDYGHFLVLGLAGAIAANSTGAGGGIVFIPAFTSLNIAGENALATSMAIQCFGMTAGSIAWLVALKRHEYGGKDGVTLVRRLLLITVPPAAAGMLIAQHLIPTPPVAVATIFKYFSILFGAMLLFGTLRKPQGHSHGNQRLRRRHVVFIIPCAFVGGMVTAWISVGVGEWLALLLFFLGYPTMISVCIAVCISALTVWAGIGYHASVDGHIVWPIVLFAAPAAMVGGSIARYLARRLGPVRLKVFFSSWILATGLVM